MRTIVLVKHAKPEQIPGAPSHDWPLSAAGREMCLPLAERLGKYSPAAIVSSSEPKALQTAAIIGEKFATTVEVVDGLHEHDRSNVPLMRTGEFISMMALFFKQPGKCVLGRESANEALARFEMALEEAKKKHPAGNLMVVTHGTVLALYLAKHSGVNGYETWRSMGLPSYVAIDDASNKITDRADSV
jgi:broad specificity phosphatase PhoE